MRVLITSTAFDDPGGIANYFSVLKDRLRIPVEFVDVGKRVNEKGLPRMMSRLIRDYARFVKTLTRSPLDLVHVNVSLNPKGAVRDGVYVALSRMFRKKVLVFFHGWDPDFAGKLHGLSLWVFKRAFFPSQGAVVLAEDFKRQLVEWGYRRPVFVETTLVDDDLLQGLDVPGAIEKRLSAGVKTILFLARLVKEKGIYETLDAVVLLQEKYPDVHLVIAGDGEERPKIEHYAREKRIRHIHFAGYVTAERKRRVFADAYVYCFPSYQEGMPTTVLEALSVGLPVVTRPVGGLVDFFENGRHGFTVESGRPPEIAAAIEALILDRALYRRIAENNYRLGREKCLASQGARRLEVIYHQIQSGPARAGTTSS